MLGSFACLCFSSFPLPAQRPTIFHSMYALNPRIDQGLQSYPSSCGVDMRTELKCARIPSGKLYFRTSGGQVVAVLSGVFQQGCVSKDRFPFLL